MDNVRLLSRVQYLAHELFNNNQQGIEFIKLMKLLHVHTRTFPQEPSIIEKHGGALGWATFREGQVTLLLSFETMANEYKQKIDSEIKGMKHELS